MSFFRVYGQKNDVDLPIENNITLLYDCEESEDFDISHISEYRLYSLCKYCRPI